MIDWKAIREKFPALEKYTYLNCAEGSPIAKEVAQAAQDYYTGMMLHGDLIYEEWLEKAEKTRKDVAEYIGADPEEIAFTTNTSTSMNYFAQMLLGKGDVLTMRGEFPTSTLPWLHNGYQVDFVEPEDLRYPINTIENKISSKTKILVSSYIQYASGFRQNVRALSDLAKKHDLYFVLNATQAFGTFPIDVKEMGVDFLCATGLKWAMAGYGIGICYISKKMQAELKFPIAGWKSVDDPNLMDNTRTIWKNTAQALEAGCLHFPNIFALGAAIQLFNSVGKENVTQRILELSSYALKKLKELNAQIITPVENEAERSGILIVKVKNPEQVKLELKEKDVILSKRGEGLRISCHIFNNFEDIDRCIKLLKPQLI